MDVERIIDQWRPGEMPRLRADYETSRYELVKCQDIAACEPRTWVHARRPGAEPEDSGFGRQGP